MDSYLSERAAGCEWRRAQAASGRLSICACRRAQAAQVQHDTGVFRRVRAASGRHDPGACKACEVDGLQASVQKGVSRHSTGAQQRAGGSWGCTKRSALTQGGSAGPTFSPRLNSPAPSPTPLAPHNITSPYLACPLPHTPLSHTTPSPCPCPYPWPHVSGHGTPAAPAAHTGTGNQASS